MDLEQKYKDTSSESLYLLLADKLKTSSALKVLNGKTTAVNKGWISWFGLVQTHFIATEAIIR